VAPVPRRRFAVALLIPPPTSIEVDGLRRALGDRQLGKIEPHITIVPPINLRDDDIADALAVVQAAARASRPMELTLGPVATFADSSPVRFLAVDPWDPVTALYRACWSGVLEREEKRSFHPHVTVDIDGGPTDRPDPALEVLAGYRAEVLLDRVTVLENVDVDDPVLKRVWEPYTGYRLGVG
jgi:2'-5' RNA ligase